MLGAVIANPLLSEGLVRKGAEIVVQHEVLYPVPGLSDDCD